MKYLGQGSFVVEGLNLTKLINGLYLQSIRLYAVKRAGGRTLKFSVDYSDIKKVIAYLDKMCYNYTLTETKGVIPFISFMLRRTGLIAGIILFAAAAYLSGLYIAEIDVTGCKTISKDSVVAAAAEAGAVKNSFSRPNVQEIERTVYEKFKNAAFVQVRYQGMILKISLVESEPEPVLMGTEVRDLISEYDGIITKLLVYQGTPLVKAGDTVKKGQVLIGGYREKPDGTRLPVRAIGEAYGEAVVNYTEIFLCKKTVQSRTGAYVVNSHIDTFGVIFPVKKAQHNFLYTESESTEIYMFYNTILPSKLITTTIYETEAVEVREDFEKVKKLIIENAEQSAVINAEKEGKIIHMETKVEGTDDVKNIVTTVHIEKSFFSGE